MGDNAVQIQAMVLDAAKKPVTNFAMSVRTACT